jgi:N-acetylglutamate synthase-like GNAT family acetyltransferase
MKKQTAVEWLEAEIIALESYSLKELRLLFNQAKTIEKEQIKNAYILPLSSEYWFKDEDFFQTESEQYYNDTFS